MRSRTLILFALAMIALVPASYVALAQEEEGEPAEEAPKSETPEKPATPVNPDAPMSRHGRVPLPRAPILKENSRLIDVEGLILDLREDLKASPVSRAVFQPKDGLGYFVLLENSVLENTLAVTAHGERPVRVRGAVTLFRGKNYLLLDAASVKQE